MSDNPLEGILELAAGAVRAVGAAGSAVSNACQAVSSAASSVNFGAAAETGRNLASRIGDCITSLRQAASCGVNLSGAAGAARDVGGAATEAGRQIAGGAAAAGDAARNAGEAIGGAFESAGDGINDDNMSIGSGNSFGSGDSSVNIYYFGTGPDLDFGAGGTRDRDRDRNRAGQQQSSAGITEAKQNMQNMQPDGILANIENELGEEISTKKRNQVTTKLNNLKSNAQGLTSDLGMELSQNNMNQFSKQHRQNLQAVNEAKQAIDSITSSSGAKANQTEASQNLKEQLNGYESQVNNTVMNKFQQHAREGNVYTMSKMSYCFGDEIGRDNLQQKANEVKRDLGKIDSTKLNMFKANNKLFGAVSSASQDIKGAVKGDKRCFDSLRKKLPSLKTATKNFQNEASKNSGRAMRKSDRARGESHASRLSENRNQTRQGGIGV
jgi:hypothetical protein